MGVIKQGILGGFSGKVGNVTGTSWKGRAVMKARPLSVANPRTAGQVTNRNAFKSVVEFASLILASLIIPIMNRFADAISGYNYFVSLNKQWFNATGIATPGSLNFGTGKLGNTAITSGTLDNSTQTIAVTWNSTLDNPFKQDADKAYLMVVDSTDSSVVYQQLLGATRQDGGDSALSPSETIVTGRTYWLYLVFLRADGTVVGNTGYLAVVAVA